MSARQKAALLIISITIVGAIAAAVYWVLSFEVIELTAPDVGSEQSGDDDVERAPRIAPSSKTLEPPSASGSLSVQVISVDGEPIPRALVEVIGSARVEPLRSGRRGAARFETLPAGSWRVRVEASRYSSVELGPVSVRGGETAVLEATLEGLKALAGRVLSAGDKGVGGARVEVWPEGSPGVVNTTWTRKSGVFVLSGLERGRHLLRASHPEHAAAVEVRTVVGSGDEVVLQLGLPGGIAGSVLDADGEGLEEFTVTVRSVDDARRPRRAEGRDGSFQVPSVQPGRYDLRVDAEGSGPAMEPGVQVHSGATTEVRIEMPVGASVRGRITDSVTGQPIPDSGVRIGDVKGARRGARRAVASADDLGFYLLRGVEPGRRSLRFFAEGYDQRLVVIRELRDRSEEVLDVALDPTPTGDAPRVQFQGIGAVLHRGDDGSVAVREVLEDGPAAQSGLRAGDVIVRVDDVSAAKLGLGEVIDLIRGERGTEVRLEVQRGPAAQTHFLIIDRGRVSYQRRRH